MSMVERTDTNQIFMTTWDELVDEQSVVRIIRTFVDSLNLDEIGFQNVTESQYGRSKYNRRDLLGLYLYGYKNKIRSSRRLAAACKTNIEVIWLMGYVQPDFRTISDFRKENVNALKNVFLEFNKRLDSAVKYGVVSLDGSKFKAWNSKDRNFTANKLDDRINRMNIQAEEYLRLMDELDSDEDAEEEIAGKFTKEELEAKLKSVEERREKYESYLKKMEEENLSQISLTDPDCKLMKNKNGFDTSYNVQVAVDTETHLVRGYETTNNPADKGAMLDSLKALKKDGEILQSIEDKGYQCPEDSLECLKNGIVPNVILPEGKDYQELETEYKENEDVEELKGNTDIESLTKCIESGVIPDVYKDQIRDMQVVMKKVKEDVESTEENPIQDEDRMKERAAEGYFVRDLERNLVYCPRGEILRQKSVTKKGDIRYANKLACKRCPFKDKCMKSVSKKYPFKEVTFSDKVTERPCKTWTQGTEETKEKRQTCRYTIKKMVKLKFYPNKKEMEKRKCTSEHPFGTIKRAMDCGYYLLKGIRKVNGEFALLAFGYNLTVATNLLGFDNLMVLMAG